MSRTLLSLFTLLVLLPSAGLAQTPAPPRWDVSVLAGGVAARPAGHDVGYHDDWYFRGRYAIGVGHYWNEHLKTEVDYSTAGEGSLYRQDFSRVDSQGYPYSYQSFHRLEQASARIVWQFGDNAWVHPYVSAGVVGDRERQRIHVPAQYQFVDGHPSILLPERDTSPTSAYRIGATAGAGAKVYLSPRAFFNGGFVGTWSQPASTLNLFAGFGLDF